MPHLWADSTLIIMLGSDIAHPDNWHLEGEAITNLTVKGNRRNDRTTPDDGGENLVAMHLQAEHGIPEQSPAICSKEPELGCMQALRPIAY